MPATRHPSSSARRWRSRLLAVVTAVALGIVPSVALAAPSGAAPGSEDSTSVAAAGSVTVTAPSTVFTGDELNIRVSSPEIEEMFYQWTSSMGSYLGMLEVDEFTNELRFWAGFDVGTYHLRVFGKDPTQNVTISIEIKKRPTTATLGVLGDLVAGGSSDLQYVLGWEGTTVVPTGALNMTVRSTTTPVTGFSDVFVLSPVPAGTSLLTVSYPGDERFEASSSRMIISVPYETPDVTVALDPAAPAPGQTVTATATVTNPVLHRGSQATYADTVTLSLPDGTTATPTASQVSVGTSRASATFVAGHGAQTVTATTVQDAYFSAASGSVTADVDRAATDLTLDVPPAHALQDRTITVTASAPGASTAPTGQVILDAGTVDLGPIDLVDGVGTWTGRLPAGTYDVLAFYPGDDLTLPAEKAVPVVVERAVPVVDVVAPTSLTLGQAWTVDVDVREQAPGAPDDTAGPVHLAAASGDLAALAAPVPAVVGTGQVRVLLDGAELSSTSLVDGRATVTVDSSGWTLSPGTHTLSVVYDGDENFASRTVDAVLEVAALPGEEPPVVGPPAEEPPVVTPPGEEPVVTPDPVGPVTSTPLPGVAQPALLPVPAATPPASDVAAPTRALAQSGADARLLLLLGPLFLAGVTLVIARRSAPGTTR